MTRSKFPAVMLYALSLQWHWVPLLSGVPVPGQVSTIVFGALWLIAAAVTYRQSLTLPNFVAAFMVLYAVGISVALWIFSANVGTHARDVPIEWQLLLVLIQSSIFATALALPNFVRLIRRVKRKSASGRLRPSDIFCLYADRMRPDTRI